MNAMRLRQLRTAALAGALGIGIVSIGLIGARSLRAANMPVSTPETPAESKPVKDARSVFVKTRVLEKITPKEKAADGSGEENVLQSPNISTLNDQKGAMQLVYADEPTHSSKWNISVQPHINDDNTITVQIAWEEQESTSDLKEGETHKEHRVETKRRVKPGQVERVSLIKGDRSELILEFSAQEIKA